MSKMSKASKILILVLALAVITSGVALAAWLVTRTTTKTGYVDGSFTLVSEGDCPTTIGGVLAHCAVMVANEYDGTLYLSNPVVTADRTDVVITNVRLSADQVPPLDPSGAMVQFDFTPDVDAPAGAIVFTISADGSDTP